MKKPLQAVNALRIELRLFIRLMDYIHLIGK